MAVTEKGTRWEFDSKERLHEIADEVNVLGKQIASAICTSEKTVSYYFDPIQTSNLRAYHLGMMLQSDIPEVAEFGRRVLDWLEGFGGRIAVTRPDAERLDGNLHEELRRSMEALGHLASGESIPINKVAELRRAVRNAISALMQMEAEIDLKAQKVTR